MVSLSLFLPQVILSIAQVETAKNRVSHQSRGGVVNLNIKRIALMSRNRFLQYLNVGPLHPNLDRETRENTTWTVPLIVPLLQSQMQDRTRTMQIGLM